MTYWAKSGPRQMSVSLGDIAYTGPLSANDYLTLTLDVDENSVAGSGTTILTLNATIDEQASFDLSVQYSAVTLISDGSNWFVI